MKTRTETANGFDQCGNVLGRSVLRNPMTKIKHMSGAVTKTGKHTLSFVPDRGG